MIDAEGSRPLVVAAVEDIFFSAMIEPASCRAGVELKLVLDLPQLQRVLDGLLPDLIILDLNSKTCLPLVAIRQIKADPRLAAIPLVGFLSHVQADLEAAAREAGCDRIMPRSAFSRNLQKILELAKG